MLRAYAASDRRVFEVPCPACGAFHEIMWADIEWQESRPDTAAYRCPHCMTLVAERHKAQMVSAGRWCATAPEVVGHAGFRLSALVSLLANWPPSSSRTPTQRPRRDRASVTGRGNRDGGHPPQRGGVEQLFGRQSQAMTLACVVGRRARRGEYRTTMARDGEHHVSNFDRMDASSLRRHRSAVEPCRTRGGRPVRGCLRCI